LNKIEFINKMKKELQGLPEQDKKELLYDYEEHFNIGIANGRDEDEIAQSLGNPKVIARELKANYHITKAESDGSIHNLFRAVFASVGLGFFNLVFVLGPFIGVAAVIFSFYVAGFAIGFSGIVTIIGGFVQIFNPGLLNMPSNVFITFLVGIGLIALGIAFLLTIQIITKQFIKLTIKYLNLNLSIIRKRRV
jgi:uncharacterized membrane protein